MNVLLYQKLSKILNVCWNNEYRKVFAINIWESVKPIDYYCDRLDSVHLIHKRQLRFLNMWSNNYNLIVSECYKKCIASGSFAYLFNKYDFNFDAKCLL